MVFLCHSCGCFCLEGTPFLGGLHRNKKGGTSPYIYIHKFVGGGGHLDISLACQGPLVGWLRPTAFCQGHSCAFLGLGQIRPRSSSALCKVASGPIFGRELVFRNRSPKTDFAFPVGVPFTHGATVFLLVPFTTRKRAPSKQDEPKPGVFCAVLNTRGTVGADLICLQKGEWLIRGSSILGSQTEVWQVLGTAFES